MFAKETRSSVEAMEGDKKKVTVVVTGASGYIAGEVIHQLLAKGYHVKGSVRNVNDESKTKHLKESFPGLELFEADLLSEGSFDEGLQGADYVMHTASPFQIVVPDPQKDLVDPALNGTLNVLRAAAKAGTVKRIVLTSSVAAVVGETLPEGKVFSEADWNLESRLDLNPYRLSKRLAEEAAWKFVKEHQEQGGKMDLVTICPSFVLGPPHSVRVDATSIKTVKAFMTGAYKDSGAPPAAFGCVDVRDVAKAHVAAMEKEEASGRYLLTSSVAIPHFQWGRWIAEHEEFKDYPLPDKVSAPLPAKLLQLDNSKAQRELGIEFTPIKSTIIDMARSLVALGIVEKP